MVRIINYTERVSDSGKSFFTLELQGGIEMIKSKSTGKFYATAKKASIISTFDADTCKALIGTEIDGSIQKEECEAYEYTIKDTGEVIELTHRYTFLPPEEIKSVSKENSVKAENIFSQNGILEPSM